MKRILETILVPQGAEYKAVCRGLSHVKHPLPLVVPIPVGSKPVTQYLAQWQQTAEFLAAKPSAILVIGLCGSLSPELAVGNVTIYHSCVYQSSILTSVLQTCNGELTSLLQQKLREPVAHVRALTSDRMIYSAAEKRHLGQLYDTQVVDMEGFAVLKVLTRAGMAVAMVRVISDDSRHHLPNLTSALTPDGSLQPLPLAMGMIRQPIAATRLIWGAMHGLRVLQNLTSQLFSQ